MIVYCSVGSAQSSIFFYTYRYYLSFGKQVWKAFEFWGEDGKNQVELERHAVKRIPPPGWTIYTLYPNDRLDLDSDLNQNRIGLFLSPNQLEHIFLSWLVEDRRRFRLFWSVLVVTPTAASHTWIGEWLLGVGGDNSNRCFRHTGRTPSGTRLFSHNGKIASITLETFKS